MTFNEKIIRLRRIKGLTQDEFASAVSVSRQAVYKWESGQSYPEVPKLLLIKELFGISIDDLLDESYEVAMPENGRKRASKKVKAQALAIAEGRNGDTAPKKEQAPVEVVEEKPTEQIPAEAVEEKPVEEVPVEAVEQAPVEEAPAEAVDEAPVEEAPAEVVEEAPVEAAEEKPAEQAPVEAVEEKPVEVKEEPAQATVVDERPNEKIREEEEPKKKGFFARIFGRK